MSLMKNGQASGLNYIKHICVWYFSIKNKITFGEIKLEHCLVERMLANLLTKHIQGSKFKEMRAAFMNCLIDYNNKAKA